MAVRLTVAFVCPTPPSVYELQLIVRLGLTVHVGGVEGFAAPVGAFAEFNVAEYVPGATLAEAAAGNATAATSTIARGNRRRGFLILDLLFRIGFGAAVSQQALWLML